MTTQGAAGGMTAVEGADAMVRLRGITHVALDMDGTIYCGSSIFPFTEDFLLRMERLGIGCSFLTNNSSKSRADYVAKLAGMGLEVLPDQIHSSTDATLAHLRAHYGEGRKLFVIGTESMKGEVRQAGFPVVSGDEEPEAVLVAFDTDPSYADLCKAAWWISRGLPYLATHPDMVCPTDQPTVMIDCGAICEMLRAATGRSPDVVPGKPSAGMLTALCVRNGISASQLAMVGDRLYTDIEMARRTGALGVLVLTGEATLEDVRKEEHRPDLVLENIAVLGEWLEKARSSDT